VRGSARYPPIASHFCWASTQDRLTAASRNLKHPSSSASSQPPRTIMLQKKSTDKLIIYFRRYGCCFFGAVTKMRNMYSWISTCEITLLNTAFIFPKRTTYGGLFVEKIKNKDLLASLNQLLITKILQVALLRKLVLAFRKPVTQSVSLKHRL
jgi:hypothetical protein